MGTSMNRPTLTRRTGLKALAGAAGVAGLGGLGYYASQQARAADMWTIADAATFTSPDGQINQANVTAFHLVEWSGFDIPVAAVAWKDVVTIRPNGENISHELYNAVPGEGGYPGPAAGLVHVTEFQNQDGGSWGGGDGTIAVGVGGGEWSEDLASQDRWAWQDGRVHADIDWNFIIGGSATPGTFDPYDEDLDPNGDPLVIEEPDDGAIRDSLIRWEKNLHLYADIADVDGASAGDGTQTQGDTAEVVAMPSAEGKPVVQSVAEFVLSVENEPSSGDSSGDGTSSTS